MEIADMWTLAPPCPFRFVQLVIASTGGKPSCPLAFKTNSGVKDTHTTELEMEPETAGR